MLSIGRSDFKIVASVDRSNSNIACPNFWSFTWKDSATVYINLLGKRVVNPSFLIVREDAIFANYPLSDLLSEGWSEHL